MKMNKTEKQYAVERITSMIKDKCSIAAVPHPGNLRNYVKQSIEDGGTLTLQTVAEIKAVCIEALKGSWYGTINIEDLVLSPKYCKAAAKHDQALKESNKLRAELTILSQPFIDKIILGDDGLEALNQFAAVVKNVKGVK